MENSVLRVGVSVWDYMKPECVSTSRGCSPGPELEIIYLAAQMMNLSIEFVLSNEKGCGIRKRTPDSSYWTSLMGMLARNEIDITGNICYLMQERLQSFNATCVSKPRHLCTGKPGFLFFSACFVAF
ncbi:5'-AMP-activated protein [Trichinella pseudospiralis]